MRRSMADWIPSSGEGRNPSSSRFAVRSGRLRRRVARTAYTNILGTTQVRQTQRQKAHERAEAQEARDGRRDPRFADAVAVDPGGNLDRCRLEGRRARGPRGGNRPRERARRARNRRVRRPERGRAGPCGGRQPRAHAIRGVVRHAVRRQPGRGVQRQDGQAQAQQGRKPSGQPCAAQHRHKQDARRLFMSSRQ